MIRNVESRNILQGLFNKWNKSSEDSLEPQELYHLSFYKNGTNRFMAKFGNVYLCTCGENEKDNVVSDFNKYKSGGYSTLDIKQKLRKDYSLTPSQSGKRGGKPKHKKKTIPKAPLTWSKDGELLLNGLHSGLLPSNVAMIQTLHANHSNPFIFADYVCQNLPEARPSVINYICMNYDKIPFNDLIKEGMKIMDRKRGF